MNTDPAGAHAVGPDPRPTRDEAIASASRVLAAARAERDALYASAGGGREGALAVARAAHRPGGPSVESIAQTYETWVREEIAKRDAAKGSAA
jgi:hypothetical protein